MEKIIQVNSENIDKEHICCAISDKKSECGVKSKKLWLRERFRDGLVFKKADIKGKVFIEYIPAEKAWCPIEADGYMYINCLWVSGQYKGKGLGGRLLDECINDSVGMHGIVIVSSKKKTPFLSDKKFLIHKGFEVCDSAPPYYELLCLKMNKSAPTPKFRECAKSLEVSQKKGAVIFYSHQCPFCEYYVGVMADAAKEEGIQLVMKKYEDVQQAQNAPCVSTTFSLFMNGRFVTHEIMTKEKFKKLISR